MATAQIDLPEGFVLDPPPSVSSATLPEGFVLDAPPKRKDIIDTITGGKEEIPIEDWVARGLYQTGKDITTAPLHFVNQLAFNLPRSIANKYGMDYPEAESGVGTVASKTAGLIGGVKNPLVGWAVRAPNVGQMILRGAVTGGAYTPTGDILAPKERLETAAVGGGLPLLGVSAQKAGSVIRGGLQALGKSSSDYVTTKVAPKAYQYYQDAIQNMTPEIQKFAEQSMKVPKNAIKTVKRLGVDRISAIRQAYNDSTDEIYQKIEQGFANKRELADDAYAQAMDNPPKNFGGTIDVRNTVKTMKNVFKGSLGEATRGPQGNRLYMIMQELESRMPDQGAGFYSAKGGVPTPTEMKRVLRGEKMTDIQGEVRLNTKQFTELRDALNGLYRENPYDRNIAKVMDTLYHDGESSGLTGLLKARNLQREAFEAEENLYRKGLINEKKLDNFQKLSANDVRQLRDIEKYTGTEFVDDLDAVTADRALDKLREYNPERFVNDLNKASNPAWTKHIQQQYESILGKDKAKEIFDEVIANRRGRILKRGGVILGGLAATAAAGKIGKTVYDLTKPQ